MPDWTTTLTSTGFATVIAATVLMPVGCAPASAAADCLSGPNHAAPGGSHWRYRVDRQNHRKCWYLADAAGRSEQAVSARLLRLANRPLPLLAGRMPPSTADAHAELPLLTYTEPFIEGPRGVSPEEPVPRDDAARSNADPSPDSESPAASPGKASTDAPPQLVSAADDPEAEGPSGADESAVAATVRLKLFLLLMAVGLGVIGLGAMALRRSDDPVSARLNGDPLDGREMPGVAGQPEEALERMAAEERAALALAQDIPLFLVRGRIGAD
jgi:hypothetical protein